MTDKNTILFSFLTEDRLNKGVKYLIDAGKFLDTKSTSDFIRYITEDIIISESSILEEYGISDKNVKEVLSNRIKDWYFKVAERL